MCLACFNILKFLVEVTIFGLVIALCTLSSKEPFKSHIIGDMSNYFKMSSTTSDSPENIPLSDTILINPSSLPENISQEYLNNSFDITDIKYSLKEKRQLASDSFCEDMEESFKRNEGKELSYIFNLKYQTIRKINIALIVVILSYILLYIVVVIVAIIFENSANDCLAIIGLISSILLFLAWIAKFVLSLLLLYYIESSDIRKYDDFLECKNVQTKFFDKFADVDKLRKIFIAFAVLNIISESIDKAKDLFESCCPGGKAINNDSKITVST